MAKELTLDQLPDGGWSLLPSDAYATGQTLYALNHAVFMRFQLAPPGIDYPDRSLSPHSMSPRLGFHLFLGKEAGKQRVDRAGVGQEAEKDRG
jgi:hypothetical protein